MPFLCNSCFVYVYNLKCITYLDHGQKVVKEVKDLMWYSTLSSENIQKIFSWYFL